MRMALFAAPLLATLCCPSIAQEGTRTIGNWYVFTEYDRIDNHLHAFAGLIQGGHSVAVRCLGFYPSILLADDVPAHSGDFANGMPFTVQFRADRNPIIETSGTGLSRTSFEITTPVEMVHQIMDSHEITFRITYQNTQRDWVFHTAGAREALADVVKTCKILQYHFE